MRRTNGRGVNGLDVGPGSSAGYVVDGSARYTEQSCNTAMRFPSAHPVPHVTDLLGSENGQAVALASWSAFRLGTHPVSVAAWVLTALNRITTVVCGRTERQMLRSNAPFHIARVDDVVIGSDGPSVELPRHPMCTDRSAVEPHLAVAVSQGRCRPEPARRTFRNLGFEPVDFRFTHISIIARMAV